MTTTPPDSPDDRFRLPPLEGVYEGTASDDSGSVDDEAIDDAVDEPAPPVWDLAAAADAIERIGATPPPEVASLEAAPEDDSVIAAAAAVIHAAEDLPHDEPEPEPEPEPAVEEPEPVLSYPPPSAPLPPLSPPTTQAADDDWLPDFLRADAVPTTTVATLEPEPEVREEPLEATRMAVARPSHKPTVARTVAEIPILLIVAAVIAFLVKTFLAQAYYIPSGSMLPQLQIDDRVVVSKLAYKTHHPRRGDIVVFDDPRPGVDSTSTVQRTGFSKWIRKVGEGVGVVQPSTDEFIKRVIGLPGDRVEGHDGHVFVNNHQLIEPYLPVGVTTSDFPQQVVAKGRLWVMGDNRNGSADSRVFGQIKINTIVGRAVVKVWPFDHISFL